MQQVSLCMILTCQSGMYYRSLPEVCLTLYSISLLILLSEFISKAVVYSTLKPETLIQVLVFLRKQLVKTTRDMIGEIIQVHILLQAVIPVMVVSEFRAFLPTALWQEKKTIVTFLQEPTGILLVREMQAMYC